MVKDPLSRIIGIQSKFLRPPRTVENNRYKSGGGEKGMGGGGREEEKEQGKGRGAGR
jgi:hypothetical protein